MNTISAPWIYKKELTFERYKLKKLETYLKTIVSFLTIMTSTISPTLFSSGKTVSQYVLTTPKWREYGSVNVTKLIPHQDYH